MNVVKYLLGFLLITAFTYFSYYNMGRITITYYFGPKVISLPLSITLLGSFLIGFFIAWLVKGLKEFKLHREIKRRKKRERALEEEIVELKDRTTKLYLAQGRELLITSGEELTRKEG